jgi:hypothetical protein
MNLTRFFQAATGYDSKEEAKLAMKRGQRVFIDRFAVEKVSREGGCRWIVVAYLDKSIRYLIEAT